MNLVTSFVVCNRSRVRYLQYNRLRRCRDGSAATYVSDIFRRAQAARSEHPDWSYKQIKDLLVKEFSGGPFPPLYTLTIPEQDDRAPEEDWTAGLPIIRRGIQFQDWKEVPTGSF